MKSICIRDLSNCSGSMFQPAYTNEILQHTSGGLVENYFKFFILDGDTILDYNWYCDNALSLEKIAQTNINLYPNPAVNLINFAEPSDIKNIIIYNLDGATVKGISVNDKASQIYLTDFSRGIYIAEITMEDGSLLGKNIVLQ